MRNCKAKENHQGKMAFYGSQKLNFFWPRGSRYRTAQPMRRLRLYTLHYDNCRTVCADTTDELGAFTASQDS